MSVVYIGTTLAPANNQLAAYVSFTSDEPVIYSYKVIKRSTSSTSMDFNYTHNEWVTTINSVIKVPVIGLYANYNNEVQFIFTNEAGAEVYNKVINISTLGQSYRESTIFHLAINQTDPEKFSTVWDNSWLMTTLCDGYDQNGDLRCYYALPYRNQMLKTHNGYFYIGSDEDEHWYGRRFYKIDILGNEILEYQLRDSDGNLYANTHDLVWDSTGALYMIGNDSPDRSTNTMRQDAWILKFNDLTGKMIWAKNYTREFDDANILNNSPTNDAHLNSLCWLPASSVNSEAIIVHTRSTSVTFGISPDDGRILWTINTGGVNPQFPKGQAVTRLDTAGIINKENGAHTVLITANSAFDGFTTSGPGKFVFSVFDNRSCMDSDGVPVTRPITEDASSAAFQTKPARVLFYRVDLNANTVVEDTHSPIELPATPVPQITDFMGAVFDHNDHYTIYTNHARSFFISDVNGNIIASIYDVICTLDGYPEFPGECYRARLFARNELTDLVNTAVVAANG
ncbi:aryl-sulfate sulfotransferase [Atlantibacter sp.]|uniref:aryl-sulfate sulfotransferase n=1 Tax=Atlantibacter sp. TaxID=1903473 RepID=UPI0028A74693|nr:aryl-sulfate sulfotransferase [Atlantibacter sp.]